MKRIPLTQGRYALVDDEDWELVSNYNWHLEKRPNLYYAAASKSGERIAMHRLIMKAKKGQSIDHISSNGLDNQRYNLRFATPMQNQQNSRVHKNTKSQFKGVSACHNKWIARIRINKIRYYLGIFTEERGAGIAYDRKAIEVFGEFARLNVLLNPQSRSQALPPFS